MSFASLKANRATAITKLVKAAEAVSGGNKKFGDDRLWKPTVDKSNNGFAVIRFLPSADSDGSPWAQYWDHGFKGSTGRWYIQKSLTSIGKDDPCSEMNNRFWNNGTEKGKDTARKYKRRLHYVSNIMVVTDPGNPANEGKIFHFVYGKKIFDKIMDAMQPQFADEEPINPFDFWTGADFKLKIRDVEGFRNYDKSEFAKVTELAGGDEAQLEEIFNGLHSFDDYTNPEKYPSYDELKALLVTVLGTEIALGEGAVAQMQHSPTPTPAPELREELPGLAESSVAADSEPVAEEKAEDEEGLSYFASLANDFD